jgi:hypothetical protein
MLHEPNNPLFGTLVHLILKQLRLKSPKINRNFYSVPTIIFKIFRRIGQLEKKVITHKTLCLPTITTTTGQ